MTYSHVVLTEVNACVDCGMMQPTGFRGGTPIVDTDDPDPGMVDTDEELPDHVDERYNVWASHQPCRVCGSQFFHRLSLPYGSMLDMALDATASDYVAWGDL